MSHDRTGARRADARALRPSLDGYRLEPRMLLSATVRDFPTNQFLLTHPQSAFAKRLNTPRNFSPNAKEFSGPVYNHGVVDVNTARGGASAIVAAPDGSRFRISLSLADNQLDGGLSAETGSSASNVVPSTVTQPKGTIRVYAMPGGMAGIIIDGSTQYQQLTIDPLPVTQRKSYAHSFGYGESGRSHILNIGSIQVNSGQIQAVLGFHSANLAGPLTIGGTGKVDRIAFNALSPGAAIGVGGTLNTLDIANDANLSAGVGIRIGGDLNLLNIGGDLTLANGANIVVGRFAGVTPQPPKGTGTGSNILSLNQSQIGTGTSQLTPSIAAYIQGNATIGSGSTLAIRSGIASSSITSTNSGSPTPILINGSLNLASGTYNPVTGAINSPQINIPSLRFFNQFAPTVNFVGRNGLIINGTTILSHP